MVNQPVLSVTEVIDVSEFNRLPSKNTAFFEIQLSGKGYHTLKELSTEILSANLALVIDDQVLFVINYSTTELFRVIRIQRAYNIEGLKLMHSKLKDIVEKRKE